ncbi:MAG: hypothetical protein ABI386_09080 [Rhodanobacter sp.]
MVETHELLALPVLLALEPVAGEPPARLTFARDEAAALVQLIAVDLLALVPQVENARLALAGALFDPVELLRPGFPVWAALDELARRVPRGTLEHVVAFGSHDGRMPAPSLEPSPSYAGGPMRLLPLSLLAPAALADELSDQLEVQLVGRGEVGTATADWLMRTLGIRLEHARYLSRDDLLAMTCVQYEHVNLAPLWALLETALLTPQREEQAVSARGLSLRYADGAVHVQSPAQWLARQHGEAATRVHDFAGIIFELRQYAALLDAHQIPLQLQASGLASEATDRFLLEDVASPEPALGAVRLYAHEAAALGVVALTATQAAGHRHVRVLAQGYPLRPDALEPLRQRLAERFDVDGARHAQGPIVLDEHGDLGAPCDVAH